jgi:hypothetical protein
MCTAVTRKRNLWILSIAWRSARLPASRLPRQRDEYTFQAGGRVTLSPAVFGRNCIFHVQPFVTVI